MSTAYSAASVIIPAQGGGGKADTLYGWRPDVNQLQDFTVQRNTAASRVNEAGLIEFVGVNVPRFDWGEGGSCPKLLVEPERMNLALRSEEFDDAVWSKTNVNIRQGTGIIADVTANFSISPDGTQNADRVVLDLDGGTTSSDRSGLIQIISSTAGVSASIYLKSNTSNCTVRLFSTATAQMIANVTTDWQRFVLPFDAGNTIQLRIYLEGGATSDFADLSVWGAQLEEGSNATSYIKTEASQETRNADVISKTGIASLIGQSEGTLFVDFEYKQPSPDQNGRLLQLYATNDTTNSILPLIFGDGSDVNKFQLTVFSAGNASVVIQASGSTVVPFGRQKFAIAYNSGAYTIYRNGLLFVSGSGPAPASLDSMSLGVSPFAERSLANPINQAALYKTRLTNDELAALTTL